MREALRRPEPFERFLDRVEKEQVARTGGREAWPMLVVGRTVRESAEGWSPRWPLVPVAEGVRGLRRIVYGPPVEADRALRPLRKVEPVLRRASGF